MGDLTATQIARMKATFNTFLSKTATRRRFATVEDTLGNQIRDAHSDVTGIPVEIWQKDQSELLVNRDQQAADYIARVPSDTDIEGRDQLIVDGRTYEVTGPPADMRDHIRADIRYVEG